MLIFRLYLERSWYRTRTTSPYGSPGRHVRRVIRVEVLTGSTVDVEVRLQEGRVVGVSFPPGKGSSR